MKRVVLAAFTSLLALTAPFTAHGQEFPEDWLRIDSSEALYAALEGVNPPRHVRLVRGEYNIDRPLSVPDHTTLVGEGVMRYDAAGTPAGFEPGSETTLKVTKGFLGDALILANGASIRGLAVLDLVTGAEAPVRREGNAVVVASRAPGDVVNAAIIECEIHNPNSFGFSEEGPTGHGVLVLSRNPGRHLAPPPHADATVDLLVERTIIRTVPGGGAVFAINFAPRATTRITLTRNRIEGPLTVSGGVSRPDLVTEARMVIRSEHNQYGSTKGPLHPWGWTIIGGSSAPHHSDPLVAGARINSVEMRSTDDRIDGAVVGIRATAARRFHSTSGPVSDNRVELDLQDLQVRTPAPQGADLVLHGAFAEPDAKLGTEFPVGDRNVLRIRVDGAKGSGVRANVYNVDSGASPPDLRGVDNRIEILGAGSTFASRNSGFEPPPPSAYFVGDG